MDMTITNLEQFTDSFGNVKYLKNRFHPESNIRYKAQSLEELTANNYKMLLAFINHHQKRQVPRLKELFDYANARNHGILEGESRRHEDDMSDSRAVHNFGGTMATFKKGYLTGVPIRVEYEESELNQESIISVGKDNDFDDLNRRLVSDLSKAGRAYDIVYRRDDDMTKVRKLSPLETFVVYDYSLSQKSLCSVRYYRTDLFDTNKVYVELYTAQTVQTFELKGNRLIELSFQPHAFGKVPITEYLNDEDGMGDYESVLALIDLYDAGQSDTANFMADLSDAILAIIGDINFPDDLDDKARIDYMKMMRKARLMMLKPPKDLDGKDAGSVDAKYLYKQYDVNGTEAYKTRIENDIHKMTGMPNLSDDSFSGTQSGVAMSYKLFGFDQKRVDTQTLFDKALRRRYELIATVGQLVGEFDEFNPTKLKIYFTPNLPKAMNEIIEQFKNLGGVVSNSTALRVSGIVDDPEAEAEKIKEEESTSSHLVNQLELADRGEGEGAVNEQAE